MTYSSNYTNKETIFDTGDVVEGDHIKNIYDELGPSPGVVLIWDGVSNYDPSALRAASGPKEFRGPTDPDGLSGVVLNDYDTWVDTT